MWCRVTGGGWWVLGAGCMSGGGLVALVDECVICDLWCVFGGW